MRQGGPACRLTVFVGEADRYHHRPLYAEIVHRAHRAGLAGASVFRGIEGFGSSSQVHTSRLLSLSENLPVMIVIVDDRERVERFALELDEIIREGLVVFDDVTVARYGAPDRRDPRGPRPDPSDTPGGPSPGAPAPGGPAPGGPPIGGPPPGAQPQPPRGPGDPVGPVDGGERR